jgi:hypothetical protein
MGARVKLVLAAALLVSARSDAATQVSNLAEPLGVEFTSQGTFAHASSFTTGGSASQLTSITVSVFTNLTGTSELRLRTNASGAPGTLIESLGSQTLPSNQGNVLLTFSSPGSPTLSANTTYWVTLGETGSGDLGWDGTTSTAESSPASWTIGDQMKRSSDGGATWVDVNFGPPNESGKFAVEASAIQTFPDIAVTDATNRSIFLVHGTTGDRSILSGCADSSCSSQVGSGIPFQAPLGLIRRADGFFGTTDADAAALLAIDPANGNRTVLSGCADPSCTSIIGAGINLVQPTDAVVAGTTVIVTDARDGVQGAVLIVDPATGNRTTLSGCANNACSSIVGSGQSLMGPLGAIRTAAGQVYILDNNLIENTPVVLSIDPGSGNRTVISGCIVVGGTCSATVGSGLLPIVLGPGAVAADGGLLVAGVATAREVLRIDPATGNRSVVSGCNNISCSAIIGTGPLFSFPRRVTVAANGSLLVTDSDLPGVIRVDPATGNRTVITSTSVGIGPSFQTPIAPIDLPEAEAMPALVASIAMMFAMDAVRRRSVARRRRRCLSAPT